MQRTIGRLTDCCGSRSYDRVRQICCNGKILDRMIGKINQSVHPPINQTLQGVTSTLLVVETQCTIRGESSVVRTISIRAYTPCEPCTQPPGQIRCCSAASGLDRSPCMTSERRAVPRSQRWESAEVRSTTRGSRGAARVSVMQSERSLDCVEFKPVMN